MCWELAESSLLNLSPSLREGHRFRLGPGPLLPGAPQNHQASHPIILFVCRVSP